MHVQYFYKSSSEEKDTCVLKMVVLLTLCIVTLPWVSITEC